MKKVIALLLTLILLLSLVACGGQNSGSGSSQTGGSGNSAEPVGDASKDEPEGSTAPVKGGILKIATINTPQTLSWFETRGIMQIAQIGYILEPLMRYTATGIPEAVLLESCTPDAEANTWTLVLKDGIYFSDGSKLDAETLAWNLEYYKENGILAGSFFKSYNNAEVVDEKTVVCHFNEWDALFDYSLCRTVLVTSKAAFDEHGVEWLKQNPIGTGPFVFKEMSTDVKLSMERNDNYWQGEVNFDGVDLVCYAEELVAATALKSDEVQAMTTENYSMVEQMKDFGMEEYTTPLPSYAYTLCYNSKDKNDPFSIKEVREAASYAIDTKSILNTLSYGHAIETNQWAVPDSPFYNTDVQAQPFDVEKAKTLMTDGGYANGFKTTLTFNSNSPLLRDTAQMIQEQLAALNIEVTLRPIDPSAYVNYIGAWEEGILLHTMGMEAGAASQYTTTFVHGIDFGLGVNAFDVSDGLSAVAASISTAKSPDARDTAARETAKIVFDDDVLCKVVLVTASENFVTPKLQNHNYCTVQNLRGDVWSAWLEK